MATKRFACLMIAIVLFISALPVSAVAAGPAPASGNYQKWIDRIADLPAYAKNFYAWLEANTGLDGALANPAKATALDGGYIHPIHELKGSVALADTSGSAQIQNLIMDAVAEEVQTIMDYTFEVYGAFDRDHPEVFWLDNESLCGMSLHYSTNIQSNTASYDVDVFFYLTSDNFDVRMPAYRDPSVLASAIAKRDRDIQRILADCPKDCSAAEQVRYLNRVLTESNSYNSAAASGNNDDANPTAWKCISALAGSVGVSGPVCEGYARAFKVLCDRLGIPCVLTEGYAKGSKSDTVQSHMWNYVQIDGRWYAVDTTWNDPWVAGCEMSAISGREREKFLLVGKLSAVSTGLTFGASHQVRNQIHSGSAQYTNGPVLSSSAYVFETVDPDPVVPDVTEPIDPKPQDPKPQKPTPQDPEPQDPNAQEPEQNPPVQDVPDNYLDITPYRGQNGYTAPQKAGYVFTGWFEDEALTVPVSKDTTTGFAYAGFVDADILCVKCQLSDGTTAASQTTDLRLLTGISTLQLQGVTFSISWSDMPVIGSGLYEQVLLPDTSVTATALFGQDAAYVMTCTLTDVPQARFDEILTIIPGWYTLDGTFVTGETRSIRISDGL